MHIPEHNYMTYKKQSNLGYFAELQSKKPEVSSNILYKTMKSYSAIYKLCSLFNKGNSSKSKKESRRKKISTLTQNRSYTQQSQYLTSIESNSTLQTGWRDSQKRRMSLSRKKLNLMDMEKTFTQINCIRTRADTIQTNLNSNKGQIKVIKRYNNLLDTYYDRIPSPSESVTRQSIAENEKFIKFCKEDVFLEMNRNPRKQTIKQVDQYHEPDLPKTVKKNLIKQIKQEVSEEKAKKESKKNKVLIRHRFLSIYGDSKSQVHLNH